MSAVYPLSEAGAAGDLRDRLVAGADVALADLTPWPRFGLKGAGAEAWFADRVDLPEVNRVTEGAGLRVLRLGTRDIMVLSTDAEGSPVQPLRSAWEAAPQSYSSWREETWAWLRLTGPKATAVARRLTAFDLRAAAFGESDIAQTRFAHQDGVLLRTGDGFDVLFDIASTAKVVTDIRAAIDREEVFG
ncbi:MAG: hypothetical protein QNJ13_00530 [Paracoccaceae bacterium]|nr:hypothetical protein [Paracoccaceae bacterium]